MNGPLVVGIGGTTRPNSSSERLLRAALDACEELGAQTQLFGGAALAEIPHFAPERPERSYAQTHLVETVRRAAGVVIATPGYHGGVSGLVKNAIDLLDDLRQDTRVYLEGRAVGCIVTAAGGQACGITLQALRGIVHSMRGWPTPLGIALNTTGVSLFDCDGHVIDPTIAGHIEALARQVMHFAGLAANPLDLLLAPLLPGDTF